MTAFPAAVIYIVWAGGRYLWKSIGYVRRVALNSPAPQPIRKQYDLRRTYCEQYEMEVIPPIR